MNQLAGWSVPAISRILSDIEEIDRTIAAAIDNALADQLHILLSAKRSLCETLFAVAAEAIRQLSPSDAAALVASLENISASHERLTARLRQAVRSAAHDLDAAAKRRVALASYVGRPSKHHGLAKTAPEMPSMADAA
ncbi:MAG: hypothetical protein H5T86_00575 [Armatimonadetes bacterium]|nr:hypothetical protein [Armatimonadota bacterium]